MAFILHHIFSLLLHIATYGFVKVSFKNFTSIFLNYFSFFDMTNKSVFDSFEVNGK